MKEKKWLIPLIAAGIVGTGFAIYFIARNRKSTPFIYNPALSSSAKIKAWIDWMTPNAKRIGKKYGLPWQALVAQTGWETGWGKSTLASEAFNFAGIKAIGNEPYVIKRTHEYRNGVKVYEDAKFRKFSNLDEGLEEYGNFFIRNPRYAQALKYPNDPYQFIVEIRKAGYATSPTYITNLHGVLDKYFA